MDMDWPTIGTLLLRTLVTTFVVRFILDVATGWVVFEPRMGVATNVLLAWCLALGFMAYSFGGGIGATAGIVACIWHIASIRRQRGEIRGNNTFTRQ